MRSSPWLVLISMVFVTSLVTANITAVKLVEFSGLVVPAAIVIFPITYIFGDVLTEVYGYSVARRVIWAGFFCNLIGVAAIIVGAALPAAPFWHDQAAYQTILGYTPRLLAASFLAYLVGEFANSIVLAKMKIATHGRWLWTRTIGSTIVGEGLDSLVFISVAFAGTIPAEGITSAIVTQWLLKTAYEVVATPLTYAVIGWLKHAENLDAYDRGTDFSPWLWKMNSLGSK